MSPRSRHAEPCGTGPPCRAVLCLSDGLPWRQPAPRRIMPVIVEVIGHLALEIRLQQPLGQLLQQPALTRQLQSFGLSPGEELLDEPVVHRGRDSLGP